MTTTTARPARLRTDPCGALLALVVLAAASLAFGAPPAFSQPATGDDAVAAAVSSARRLAAAGDQAAAAALLAPFADDPAAPAAMRVLLGSLYVELGQPEEALAAVAPVAGPSVAGAPGAGPDAAALFVAARAEMALGRPAAAESLLERSAALEPVSRAVVLLAALRSKQERHREAVELLAPVVAALDAIAASDPSFAAEIAAHYGRTLVALGEHERAVAPLARAGELLPENVETWRLLAETLLELDRADEARRALARAQELEQAAHEAEVAAAERARGVEERLARSAVEHQAGRPEEALAALRQAIEIDPQALQPRLLEVRLLAGLERTAEAAGRADELVGRAPDHPDARHLRGMVRLAAGDALGAEADLRHALAVAPDHLGAGNGLALALVALDRPAEAAAVLDRVLARWPDDALARRTRQRLEAAASP